jgi:RNA polymerase sigma factor (sigma-70 family)
MILRHVDGLSYKEAAEVLGTTPGTVGSWLHRAREMLRERAQHRESDA